MEKELAMRIAMQDKKIKNTSDFMKKTNEIALINGSSRNIFPEEDIVFATFTDYVKENCNEREKNLLIASEFLTKVWNTLHIKVQTLKENINETEKSDIILLKKSLEDLNLTSLITEGLNKKTLKFFNEIDIEKKQENKYKQYKK